MVPRPKILLAGGLDTETERRLAERSDLHRAPALDEQTLCAVMTDCVGLIARTHVPVTRRVLEAGSALRVVGVAGVGTDRVDTVAAREIGIEVLNTPDAASDAVADLALLLMLSLLRPIQHLSARYRAGEFADARRLPHGDELHQKTIGIVGMGRIGSRVARRCAAGFGARVMYNDIVPVGPFDFDVGKVEKEQLWRECDIISLHVPLTPDTRGLVDATVLNQMGADALLINTARGAVVDTAALTTALQDGQIGGAGLDVTDPEPLPAEHPLFLEERCIITPHVAARTQLGIRRMYAVADAVLEYLAGSERD